MADPAVLREYMVGDGMRVQLADATSHYFGGYYHVRIEVSADVPVSAANAGDDAACAEAMRRFGASVRFERTLERMAVPEGGIEEARSQLLAAFDATVLPYLSRDDFPRRFIASRLARKPGRAAAGYLK